jgi:hypothetical protein
LLIIAGCLCHFIALSVEVQIRGLGMRFDRSTADALHNFATGASGLTDSFRIIGILGSLQRFSV